MMILAILAGSFMGLFRGTAERVALSDYGQFINQTLTISGKVFEDPDLGLSGDLRMRLVEVEIDGQKLPGQVWTSIIGARPEIRRSDTVFITGKLKNGFGTFPASMSFAKLDKVEAGVGNDPARDLRDEFSEQLSYSVSGPAHDLGMGVLAGQKTALPNDISEAFRIAGLTHIVVASGYNLTILIRFSRRLFARISRLAALLGGGTMALGFAFVTGFSPSMMRAVLVAGLSLLAWFYGRKFHPVVLILLVAAATVAINPAYVWGDAGWYMSFFAFAGILILAPLIKAYFWGEARPKPKIKLRHKRPTAILTSLRQVFIETMSAQVLTMPIIALMLGQFAPYGILANLLVLPLVPLTMLLTFLAGIIGAILPNLAALAGWPAQTLLDYIIGVSQAVSNIPGAAQEVNFGVSWFVISITILLALLIYLRLKTKHNLREDNIVA